MNKIIIIILSLISSFTFAASTPPAKQKLTVLLDWFPNPDHAPLFVAEQLGYFKEQGLTVELIAPADPTLPPKLVAAGKADIAITYEPEFMQQVDHGLPLISIGSLIDKPLDCLVTLQSSGIKTIADLKGKKIGSGSGMSNVMLKVLLKNANLNENDIELINIRYNLTQALLTKQVDAVTGMMRNFEVPELELRKQKIVAFYPEDHGIPTYSVLIFVVNNKTIHDPRYPKFLAAVKKAVRYLDEHPKDAWESFAKHYPENNNSLNHDAWFISLPYFAEDPADFDPEEWQKFANFMQKNQMIQKVQPTSRYAVILR